MNSRYLMVASAFSTGLLGLAATFFPQEILVFFKLSAGQASTVFIQITGALYFGFALMNWMAKTVLIGGIYARPLAMGNFTHFAIAAIALIKAAISNSVAVPFLFITIVYSIFAVLFGIVLFTNPLKK